MIALDRACAGRFICGFHGTTVGRDLAGLIDAGVTAFVCYDLRNITSAQQVIRLTAEIRRRVRAASGVEAILAIDHEGGVNSQLRSAGTVFPGNAALAAGGDAAACGDAAAAMAREIRAAGFTMNLAPVLDLHDPANPGIGVRSFGEDPERVTAFALAYLAAHRRAGVLACAKHFPGNSRTGTDPHHGFAVIRRTRAELFKDDLAPYRALIRAGLPAVLTSHALYPPLDPSRPATLSPRIMTGLLRRGLGFRGIAVSDDLEMAAIERRFGFERSVELAARAGIDLIMVCHTPDTMRRAIRRLQVLAAHDPGIARGIVVSGRRLARVRRWLAGAARPPGPGVLRDSRHTALALRLARRGALVVRDVPGILPLRPAPSTRIGVINPLHTMYGWNQPVRLDVAVRRHHSRTAGVLFDPRRPGPSLRDCLRLVRSADLVIAGTYDARFSAVQAGMIRRLAATGVPLIVVATRGPTDLIRFPQVPTYLVTHNFYPVSLAAAAVRIFGA